MMDWLDVAALFVLGWFVEKVKRLAKGVLDAIWFLIWCTSTIRCLIAMHVYGPFLEQAAALRNAGQLKGTALKTVQRFESRATPKMEAWIERTGPGTPAWRKTMERMKRKSTRKRGRHGRPPGARATFTKTALAYLPNTATVVCQGSRQPSPSAA